MHPSTNSFIFLVFICVFICTSSLVLFAEAVCKGKGNEPCKWVEDECTAKFRNTIARCARGKICHNYQYLLRENVCPPGYELHKTARCDGEGENKNNYRHFCCKEDRNYEVAGLPYLTPKDYSTVHTFPDIVGQNIPRPHDPIFNKNKTKSALVFSDPWPKAQIPYYINETGAGWGVIERAEILKAIKNYEDNTCIRFHAKRLQDNGYISIENDPFVNTATNCGRSQVCGPYGGWQFSSVGPACANAEWLVHELGHSLCFGHEHQREDRDTYIYFDSNVCSANSYPRLYAPAWDLQDFPFDFDSIMMYSGCTPGDCFQRQPGQGSGRCGEPADGTGRLSDIDVLRMNTYYDCDCTRYKCLPKK